MLSSLRMRVAAAATTLVLAAAGAVGLHELAVDTAGEYVTYEEAVALKDDGATQLIQALTWWSPCSKPPSQPDSRIFTLENSDKAGLDLGSYFLVAPPRSFGGGISDYEAGRRSVDLARQGMSSQLWEELDFAAVDFEIPHVCRPEYNVKLAGIQGACDRLQELGKRVVLADRSYECLIYTNKDNWVSVLGNPTRKPGWALWNASWDNDPDFDFPRNPYGGWLPQEVILEQYSGGTVMEGVYVDLNILRFPFAKEEPVNPWPADCLRTTMWGDVRACWDGIVWKAEDGRVFMPLSGGRGLWFDKNGNLVYPRWD